MKDSTTVYSGGLNTLAAESPTVLPFRFRADDVKAKADAALQRIEKRMAAKNPVKFIPKAPKRARKK